MKYRILRGQAAHLIMMSLILTLMLPIGTRSESILGGLEKFEIDAAHSSIDFRIRFMGLTEVSGTFNELAGTILYDEQDMTRSSVTLMIELQSINTRIERRDEHLKSDDFFDVDNHPIAMFQSDSVVLIDGHHLVHGKLSLRGVTRAITAPFVAFPAINDDVWWNKRRVGFAGSFEVNRSDYGINKWDSTRSMTAGVLSDQVSVNLNLQGSIADLTKQDFSSSDSLKSAGEKLMQWIDSVGANEACRQLQDLKDSASGRYDFSEGEINLAGYKLLQSGRTEAATRVFQMAVEFYAESWSAWDSLGESYLNTGERDRAIAAYTQSLALNPKNTGAVEILRYLGRG